MGDDNFFIVPKVQSGQRAEVAGLREPEKIKIV
jgi:hypothetical protein